MLQRTKLSLLINTSTCHYEATCTWSTMVAEESCRASSVWTRCTLVRWEVDVTLESIGSQKSQYTHRPIITQYGVSSDKISLVP